MLAPGVWCLTWSIASAFSCKRDLITRLVDLGLLRGDAGIELDFAERAFILAHVLLQDGQQRLGLLRAEIDSLKILHLDFLRCDRLQASKEQQNVPYAHADLYGVGVAVTVGGRINQADVGLLGNRHGIALLE